ncbi:MAG: class II glutamine amidotransferase [Polyangiaceae bacterium]|nr:class II glutamine amidotransferase [Polyangiaceae bacterium]
MARLFGLIGNRADLAVRILGSEADALRAKCKGSPLGWGIGFYQGGEVLMRRRPIDDNETIEVAKLSSDVRTDVLVGHVRNATVGKRSTENTHPFRYRQWLYAQTGTLPSFDVLRERLIESVHGFLRSSIRGETDAEILFYVFLSFLHDAGRLNDSVVDPARVRDALRSSLAVVSAMAAEVSGEEASANLVVSNGEHVFAVHTGQQMGYRVLHGRSDADALIGDDLVLRRKTPELAQMHFTLIASDFDDEWSPAVSGPVSHARWKVAPDRAIVTLERGSDPHIEAL